MNYCEALLTEWCEKLASLQIDGTGIERLDGAIMCPACGRIHGRCIDAMYPFMKMAQLSGDSIWIDRAKCLFEWAEHTVSLPSGAYKNDIESSWDGITAFTLIQLADCLELHGDLLDSGTYFKWSERAKHAAEYLIGYDALHKNNVNYSIGCAFALLRAGKLFCRPEWIDASKSMIAFALTCMAENGMLFGEGVPRQSVSPRGCRPVDIGYNVEESLPLFTAYAREAGDGELLKIVLASWNWHLQFLLPDGGWDNSFGTRKFKWSWWGSRTTDGCCLGLMQASDGASEETSKRFITGAASNLNLLKRCTEGGLLTGGPMYENAGQAPCVHHTFDHAKMLAGIIDQGYACKLDSLLEGDAGSRESLPVNASVLSGLKTGITRFDELGIEVISSSNFRATLSRCDWEYREKICTSGGMLTLLYHKDAGAIFASGMAEYYRVELANMQTPYQVIHESLAPRIDLDLDGVLYSSVYENGATLKSVKQPVEDSYLVITSGKLKDSAHKAVSDWPSGGYRLGSKFEGSRVEWEGDIPVRARFVLPIICAKGDEVIVSENAVCLMRGESRIAFNVNDGRLHLPHGLDRIFNLTPGFEALCIFVTPNHECADGIAHISCLLEIE